MPRRRAGRRLGSSARGGESDGQILALFALFLIVLLGVSALAVDYGGWLLSRRGFQNAADAAALAGAAQLTQPATAPCTGAKSKPQCAREAAWASVKGALTLSLDPIALGATDTPQGSPYQEAGYRIWVDSPPAAAGTRYPGKFGSSSHDIFVWVERNQASSFGGVVGKGTTTVSAWATAGSDRPPQPAVAALCGTDPVDNSDCTGGNKTAVKINTNQGVKIVAGDLASDKGLVVTAGPGLVIDGGDAFIVGSGGCSPQTWSCPPSIIGGITDAGTPPNALAAIELVPPFADPLYAQPAWTNCTSPGVTANCIPVRGAGAVGPGYMPGTFTCNGNGCGAITGSGASQTCSASSPRIGPGYYDTIKSLNGCLILDATSPGSTASYTSTTGLWNGQRPGIFRVHSALSVNYLVGDGVTIFLDPGASLSVKGGIILNTNNTCSSPNPGMPTWSALCGPVDFAQAAWKTSAASPWDSCAQSGLSPATRCVNVTTGYHSVAGTGIAIFVRPPTSTEVPPNGCGQGTPGSRTSCVFQEGGGAGLQFKGSLFAPRDNVQVGGTPNQASTGQMIGWTITYSGTAELVQHYTGPVLPTRPFLLEPTLGE